MVTNNISEIRKEKHLSQDDLAVALGVCRKSIFNIEHNNVIPNIDTCLRLAKYLDMHENLPSLFIKVLNRPLSSIDISLLIINSISL